MENEKIKDSLETIRAKYTRDDNIKTDAYEKRLEQKDKENDLLTTNYQERVKELKKKFNKELSEKIKDTHEEMDKERRAMKKLVLDKDKSQQNQTQKLIDQYQVKIYKLNAKNDGRLKELETR